MKRRTLALCILALGLTIPALAAKIPMKPGKWKVTSTVAMPGLPQGIPGMPKFEPMTEIECVTRQQVENFQPPKGQTGGDCKMTKYKIEGNGVTWTMKCKDNMSGEGKMTFTGNSYKGESQLRTGPTLMITKFTGKYLGPCDKK